MNLFKMKMKILVVVFLIDTYRSNRLLMFFGIRGLKNFAIFTGKRLCWSLFSIKLQARDFNIGVFL